MVLRQPHQLAEHDAAGLTVRPAQDLSATQGWRLCETGDICWRRWDDEFVVYCAGQATTHLLGPVAGAVMVALQAQPRPQSVADISASVFPDHATDNLTREAAEAVREVLLEFERIGLAKQNP